jgi:hypothetical protein
MPFGCISKAPSGQGEPFGIIVPASGAIIVKPRLSPSQGKICPCAPS